MIPYPIVLTTVRIPKWKTRIGFTEAQMARLGGTVVRTQKERTAEGLDANDRPMEELSERYKRRKMRQGKRAIRDMRLTGNMIASLDVTEVSADEFVVGFKGATPKRKAHFRQLADNFFGISPGDALAVDETTDVLHGEIVEGLIA